MDATGNPPPVPKLGSSGQLGSLAQKVRQTSLGSVRGIFIFIGVATILLNAFAISQIDAQLDAALAAELKNEGLTIDDVDPVEFGKIRETVRRAAVLMGAGAIALGAVFIVLAIFVHRRPVAVTVTGLVLYIASIVIFGILDPATLAAGAIIKIIFIVAMAKAVSAAIAHQRAATAGAIA